MVDAVRSLQARAAVHASVGEDRRSRRSHCERAPGVPRSLRARGRPWRQARPGRAGRFVPSTHARPTTRISLPSRRPSGAAEAAPELRQRRDRL